MGLDIFFLEDIRNAILAANEASSATAAVAKSHEVCILDLAAEKLRRELPQDTSQVLLSALHTAAVGNVDRLNHYRQGYRAALVTLALAFGLSPAIVGDTRPLEIEGARPIPASPPGCEIGMSPTDCTTEREE